MNIDFDTVDVNILPRHVRCFARTFSLCVTTDVTRTIKTTEQLNTIHLQIIDKYTNLWKAASRPKSAEIIQNVLGYTLTRPGNTR